MEEADLRSVEHRLNVALPEDYKTAVQNVGLPRPTRALLDAIVERELSLDSLGDFYSPREIIEETTCWRKLGMPRSLVAFASDPSGNKFCFDADRLKNASRDMDAIWFYDHDFGTVDQIASSFDDWIEAFCRVKPWSEPDAT